MKWKKIRALIKDCSDDELCEIALAENLCRSDLNAVQRENLVYKRWKSGKYKYQKDIAKAIGISPARIGQLIEAHEIRKKVAKGETKVPLVSTEVVLATKQLNIRDKRKFIKQVEKRNIKPSEAKEAIQNLISWDKTAMDDVLSGRYPYDKAKVRIEDNLSMYQHWKNEIEKEMHKKKTWTKVLRDRTPQDRRDVFRYLFKITKEIEPTYITQIKDKNDKHWATNYVKWNCGILARLYWKIGKITDEKYHNILKILDIKPDMMESIRSNGHFYGLPGIEYRIDYPSPPKPKD